MMKIKRELAVYDAMISDDEDGVEFISIVENPAMEENFIALSNDVIERVELKLSDAKKQYFTGAVLVPDREILRVKPTPHYIKFSADNIERIRNRYFKQSGNTKETTIEHSDKKVNAVVVESWIKKEGDTVSNDFSHLPTGTWFVTMHVEDKAEYDQLVKTKKGFSIEGILSKAKHTLSKEDEALALLYILYEKLARKDEE